MPDIMPNGRVRREPSWPDGGMVSRPVDDRRFEVQAFTGRPVSTVLKGQWSRGSVIRFSTPEVRPNFLPLMMNDPTDPVRYVTVISTKRKRGMIRGRR